MLWYSDDDDIDYNNYGSNYFDVNVDKYDDDDDNHDDDLDDDDDDDKWMSFGV